MCVPTDDAEEEESADMPQEVESTLGDRTVHTMYTTPAMTTEMFMEITNSTYIEEEDSQLEFILMILIPLIFLAVLLLSVVLIVINYKRKKTKEGKYFVCSQFQTITSCVQEQ